MTELHHLTIAEAAGLFRARKLSPVELTRAYLDRMQDAVEVVHDDQPRFIELALATLGTRMALA